MYKSNIGSENKRFGTNMKWKGKENECFIDITIIINAQMYHHQHRYIISWQRLSSE